MCKIKKLLITIQEIEELLGYDALDIEFAIDNQNDVHIFQVRPITLSQEFSEHLDIRVTEKLIKPVIIIAIYKFLILHY